MAWKATGQPQVRQQRGRWVVARRRYRHRDGKAVPASWVRTRAGARPSGSDGAAATGAGPVERGHGRMVCGRWVGPSRREPEGAWAVRVGCRPHRAGLGRGRPDRLDRTDIAGVAGTARRPASCHVAASRSSHGAPCVRWPMRWTKACCAGTRPPGCRCRERCASRRGSEKVEPGPRRRSLRFLEVIADHRSGGAVPHRDALRPRRSEVLALRWAERRLRAHAVTHRRGPRRREGWSGLDAREDRPARAGPSRSTPVTCRRSRQHRARSAEERSVAGPAWRDLDLVVTTRTGTA